MASLDPTGGVIIDTDEPTFVSATITAEDFDEPVAWDWTLTALGNAPSGVIPDNFTITENDFTLVVDYVDYEGLFPLEFLDYLDLNRVVQRVGSFDDLPAPSNSPEIVAMRAAGFEVHEWELDVTATDPNPMDPLNPDTASGTYTLRVATNYNIKRDLLADAVDDRRGVVLP